MLNLNLNTVHLCKEEYKIYARHLIIDQIGIIGQQRLKKSNILCIGAGGLACPAMLYLAASGLGCLGIIDHDKVSISNLHRQILYNQNNVNELKTISAEKKIKEINPYCKINIYSYKLTKQNALELIKMYDIILDTSDNFKTRYIIDYACYKLHKIHIYGAIQNFEGQLSVFNYKNGPKYSDLYPENLNLENNTCNEIGVLGVIPGIIGILQATEAIKIIIGIGNILSGYILLYNAINMSFKKVKIQSINKTKVFKNINQHKSEETNVISAFQLKYKIAHSEKLAIIDVRQNKEFKIKHIKNAINIPLNTIKQKKNTAIIQKRFSQQTIIIYCSNNSRSIIASKVLHRNKINHYRLQDGLNSWI